MIPWITRYLPPIGKRLPRLDEDVSDRTSARDDREAGTAATIIEFAAVLLILAALLCLMLLPSCRSSAPTGPQDGLSVGLDAVPSLLKADSSGTAVIWCTVLDRGRPVADSTAVSFVASLGTIDAEARTRDGLARAVFTPGAEPGTAAIVAQVRAVRDTVLVTVY